MIDAIYINNDAFGGCEVWHTGTLTAQTICGRCKGQNAEFINLCTKLTNINCQLQSAVIQYSPLGIMAALFESVTVKNHNRIIMVKSLLSL